MKTEKADDCPILNNFLKKHDIEIIKESEKDFLAEKNKEINTSYIIRDYAKAFKNIKTFRNDYSSLKPIYQVSANNDPLLLELLSLNDVSFACFSLNEVKEVRDISSNPIIITSPILSEEELKQMSGENIKYFLVDNLEYMLLIKKYFPYASLLILFSPDPSKRFGADLLKSTLLLKKSKELELKIEGVYASVEIENEEEPENKEEIKLGKQIEKLKAIFEFYKYDFKVLLSNEESLNLFKIVSNEKENLILLSSKICKNYMTACESIYFMKINETKKEINYHLSTPDLYIGRFYHDLDDNMPHIDEEEKYETYNCTIYGPTCDTSDMVVGNVLYKKMNIGEKIIFKNVGFNSTKFSGSRFNGVEMNYMEKKIFNLLNA